MKKPDTVLHSLNAADEGAVIEISPAEAILLRQGGERMLQGLNSIIETNVDSLEEPLKGEFLKVKTSINAMLSKLPTTDAVPAAGRANWSLEYLLRAFLDAQAMIGSLGSMVADGRKKLQTATNSLGELPAKVEAEINARVGKGELFLKKDHDLALNNARTEGETAATTKFTLIGTNRTLVSTNKLPMPEDKVLGDEKFADLQKRAQERLGKLAKFTKLPEGRVTALCWLVEDDRFTEVITDLEAASGGTTIPAASAFIGKNNKDPKATDKPTATHPAAAMGVL